MFECIKRIFSGKRKKNTVIYPENDAFKRMSEATTEAGMSLLEAAEAIRASIEALFTAELEKALAELVIKIERPSAEELWPVATAREWHLMNNAKKYRVRKKYSDRVMKRYYNETQRRSKP